LREALGVSQFVNADEIARGLSGFESESVAFQAGRYMLERLRQLSDERVSFAVETTLSGRSLAVWIEDLQRTDYVVDIAYIWPRSPEVAVQRVRHRIAAGGHFVPEDAVVRRYWRSL